MPKTEFPKSDVIIFAWFLGHCTAKNRDTGLQFCTLVVAIQFYPIYFAFLSSKILVCLILFCKIKILIFVGQKSEIWLIRDSLFVERLIWHLLTFFCLRFASKPYILEAIESLPFFDSKSRDMTSLERHFFKSVSMNFAEILGECDKLMLYKVPRTRPAGQDRVCPSPYQIWEPVTVASRQSEAFDE